MKLKILFFILINLTVFADVPNPLPELWTKINENFESGNLNDWDIEQPAFLNVASDSGLSNSYGLEVLGGNDDAHYIERSDVPDASEGYLKFMFNPGNLQLEYSSSTMRIADVRSGSSWDQMVVLRLKIINNSNYVCNLGWETPDGRTNDNILIPLENNWQEILIGYKANDWVALWINGELKRAITNVLHNSVEGDMILIGQTSWADTPTGTTYFDNISFSIPTYNNVYYVSPTGSDTNSGLVAAP